ncbi:MAG: toll/interleukin-1 receptor domain-containing protein [Burkholderiales bacterium]
MVEVFFSYSHRDESYRDELEVHLSMLNKEGVVSFWHDRRIGAGEEFDKEIDSSLERADIVLLLISPYFLASDYCYEIEMKRALARHEEGSCRVIPVIIHPCEWQRAPFGKLRATPVDGKPISKFPNQHDAFLAVTKDIRAAAKELKRAIPTAAPFSDASTRLPPRPSQRQPRSSNLRIKKEFSDRDRASFALEAFEYISNYFENSLKELSQRADVDYDFRRIDANRFTSQIFKSGTLSSSCTITLGDHYGSQGSFSQIFFCFGLQSYSKGLSYNESLSVMDDGHTLGLEPLGLQGGSHRKEILSLEGGAESYWSLLISPLQ